MQTTSSNTSAAVPSGPSTGAMMDLISSMGLAFDVSTTCTGTAGGAGCGGEAMAVSGLPASWVTTGAGEAEPGNSFFSSSTVCEKRVNVMLLGARNECSFASIFVL